MKRIITLLLLITTYALSAQKTVTKIVSREQNSPLLVVNGVLIDDNKIGSIFLNAIDPNDIENINVLKSALKDPSATVLCSSKAEKGVVIITLKKSKDTSKKDNLSGIEVPNKAFPLVVVNDVEFSDSEVGKLFMNNINPKKIETIVVLKDKKATEKYGEKAKNGVILVTLKGKPEKLDIPPYEPKS
ncbi:TonB-dependent receptor plug domain-containing protein [Capnocytophaga ochracea]|uniref:TonB-dependent receptor plug domain-containing protein n=1 Tax=Capnocytophaga ochracea TaxID=1018 RepID=UPI00065F721D|nr:TonB-dependent receptor plug domain-containing protein [Capnocytophaga ochracea]UZD35311.1 TonB-dependent receptor plug domain-containing protein [Capnocytophaga ochracea]